MSHRNRAAAEERIDRIDRKFGWVIGLLLFAGALAMLQAARADTLGTLPLDTDPGTPGNECTITFEGATGDAELAQAATDAQNAVQNAFNNSADMKAKISDACQKHGGAITVHIGKKMQNGGEDVDVAEAERGGDEVWVDIADFDDLQNSLDGKTRDKEKIMANGWVWILAHEIDHLRHTDTDNHRDPDPDPRISPDRQGPAVKDENKVHGDLATGISRGNYFSPVIFTVDGQSVTWDVRAMLTTISRLAASPDATSEHTVSPDVINQIPTNARWSQTDQDVDGVPDPADNCPYYPVCDTPGTFNPQQLDWDFDGSPDVADPDDDNDGIDDILELAMGSQPDDPGSIPQHPAWNRFGEDPCRQGADFDGDGRLPPFAGTELLKLDLFSFDASCSGSLYTGNLPRRLPPPPNYLLQEANRGDLGGVPPGFDTLPSTLGMTLDSNRDGIADGVLELNGPVVIRRGDPVLQKGGTTPDMIPIEIVALSLQSITPIVVTYPGGSTPEAFDLHMDLDPTQPSTGQLRSNPPNSGTFPIDSFFDVTYRIDFFGGSPPDPRRFRSNCQLNSPGHDLWPPWGREMSSDVTADIFDETGDAVGASLGCSLRLPDLGDLEVTKDATPDTVIAGDPQFFDIFVTNHGPQTVQSAQLTDVLGPDSFFDVFFLPSSCTNLPAGGQESVVCNVGPLAPGETVVKRIGVYPRKPGIHENRVWIQDPLHQLIENNYANNWFSLDFGVGPRGSCTMVGTPGPDNLLGTGGDDVICGLGDNDNIVGGGGNDVLLGDDGNDVLRGGPGNDNSNGGNGNDTIFPGDGNDTSAGGAGVDTLSFADAGGAISANLSTGRASGRGTDTMSGIENLLGSNFNDKLIGNSLANVIRGGLGNDSLQGNAGNDDIDGGAGNDMLVPGRGNDRAKGSIGSDTVSYMNAGSGISADLALGRARGTWIGSDRLSSIENLVGTPYRDTIKGSSARNRLKGLAGNDTMYGRGGNDFVFGGKGNDDLFGGSGHDWLYGGPQNDDFFGGSGTDLCRQNTGTGTKKSCERL